MKEEQRSNRKTDKKWHEKTEIQVAIIGGVFLLLAAFISAPHWWPWSKQVVSKEITSGQLSNDQLLLVREVWRYQKENKLNKVVINKDGVIFDDAKKEPTTINLISKVSIPEGDYFRFEQLILSIPAFFLKQIPETRLGAPYVVTVPEEARELLEE